MEEAIASGWATETVYMIGGLVVAGVWTVAAAYEYFFGHAPSVNPDGSPATIEGSCPAQTGG